MITRRNYIFRTLLVLLAACGSSSFTTLPSVTHRVARPSTFSPSKLNGAAVSAVESFFITKPYVAAFLTCSVKASAADLIAQTRQCAKNVDVSRNLAFLVYGGLYQGLAQQFMYSTVFPDIFGHDLDMMGLASQVSFDMCIVGPFLCLPLAYAFKSMFSGDENEELTSLETKGQALQQGLEKYVNDVTSQGLLLKYWGLWTPVNFLTFGVVPMHFRVAFVASVSFFWILILSSVAADESNDDGVSIPQQE